VRSCAWVRPSEKIVHLVSPNRQRPNARHPKEKSCLHVRQPFGTRRLRGSGDRAGSGRSTQPLEIRSVYNLDFMRNQRRESIYLGAQRLPVVARFFAHFFKSTSLLGFSKISFCRARSWSRTAPRAAWATSSHCFAFIRARNNFIIREYGDVTRTRSTTLQ